MQINLVIFEQRVDSELHDWSFVDPVADVPSNGWGR
jgi:hypothetical protein